MALWRMNTNEHEDSEKKKTKKMSKKRSKEKMAKTLARPPLEMKRTRTWGEKSERPLREG